VLLVGQKMLQKMGNHQSKQKYAKISIGFCFGTEGVLAFVHKLGHIWKSKPKSRGCAGSCAAMYLEATKSDFTTFLKPETYLLILEETTSIDPTRSGFHVR